jgi:hypothetical protein
VLRRRINCKLIFRVDFRTNWVSRQNAVHARRLVVCVPALIAIGFASAPARAQELVDVGALEAQVEAAAELAELPAEPDWGVQDLSNSLPAVTQDAPVVPTAPAETAEAAPEPAEVAPEPRYHDREPQYRTEYHPPEVESTPPPVTESTPPAATESTPPGTSGEPAQAPATPEPSRVAVEPPVTPAVPEAASTPTIWIWIWNWTWVQASDERYRNSQSPLPVDRAPVDQNLPRILEKIGTQIPVQIGVETDGDIAGEIMRQVAAEGRSIPIAAPVAAAVPAAYRAPAELRKTKLPPRTKPAASSASLEGPLRTPSGTPLDLATLSPRSLATTDAAEAPQHARHTGKAPRPRRASRPAPTLPLHSERLTDKSTASGVSGGLMLKSFAVLIASMLLAALGRGRRLRLPSTRLQGLLGTRTDPPG